MIIECENQILGEAIDIAGTLFQLHYRSDRVPGRKVANTLQIPLSPALPVLLKIADALDCQVTDFFPDTRGDGGNDGARHPGPPAGR